MSGLRVRDLMDSAHSGPSGDRHRILMSSLA